MTRLFLVSNWNQKGPDPFLEWPGHHYSFWRWRKKPHKYHECRAMLLPKYRIYTNYFKILGGWELRTYPAGRSSLVSKAGMRLPRPLHSEFWLRTPGMKLQLRRIYWPSAPFHGQVFRHVLPMWSRNWYAHSWKFIGHLVKYFWADVGKFISDTTRESL